MKVKSIARALSAWVLCSAVLATEVGAELRLEQLRGLSLADLMEVEVVSAPARSQRWLDVPAAVHVITQEDIRRSGVTSLPEALRMVPGMTVGRVNAHTWAVSARGFAGAFSDKLLVLLDGRSIYTPLFSGVYWDAHDVVLQDVERIEVIRGPGASVWGANAVNGVINIITKDASETQGTLVHAGAGTEEEAIVALRHGTSLGEHGHVRFDLKHAARDHSTLDSGEDARDAWRRDGVGVRADWSFPGGDHLTLSGGAFEGSGLTQQDVLFSSPLDPVHFEGRRRYSGWHLRGAWERDLSERSSLSLHAHVEGWKRDSADISERRATQELRLRHQVRFRRHSLTWGVGWRRSGEDTKGSAQVSLVRSHPHVRWSGFVQDEIALGSRFDVTLGTKIDFEDHRGVGVQPTARFAWRIRDDAVLWGAVSRALRSPSRVDQHGRVVLFTAPPSEAGGLQKVFVLEGSEDAEDEKVTSFELGFRWRASERLSFDVAAYRNLHRDFRSLEPLEPRVVNENGDAYLEIPHAFDNLLSVDTWGLELGVSWRPIRRWRLSLAWSLMDSSFEFDAQSRDPFGAHAVLRDVTPHQRIHVESRLDLPGAWELDVSLDRSAGWPDDVAKPFTKANVRLGWRPHDGLELGILLHDLLEERHEEFGLSAAPVTHVERGLHASLTWTF